MMQRRKVEMDFNFLAAANGITTKYLNQMSGSSSAISALSANDDIKGRFGESFDKEYDSLQATKLLNANMRQSYQVAHQDDWQYHADRLGYSIDNRVIDMLHLELSFKMDSQVSAAMDNAMQTIK